MQTEWTEKEDQYKEQLTELQREYDQIKREIKS